MRLRNEIFLHVLDWLHKNKNVRDQAHLAAIMGISTNSMSRIMTGKNDPSEVTLRKLNEAFGNIFNMEYLRGKDPYHMLVADLSEDIQQKSTVDLGASSTNFTKSEKDIIALATDLIVELEAMRRQTKDELMLLAQARQSFESVTAELRHLLTTLSHSNTLPHPHDYFPSIAAEDTETPHKNP